MKYRFVCSACGAGNECEVTVNALEGKYLEYGPDTCLFSRNPGRDLVEFVLVEER